MTKAMVRITGYKQGSRIIIVDNVVADLFNSLPEGQHETLKKYVTTYSPGRVSVTEGLQDDPLGGDNFIGAEIKIPENAEERNKLSALLLEMEKLGKKEGRIGFGVEILTGGDDDIAGRRKGKAAGDLITLGPKEFAASLKSENTKPEQAPPQVAAAIDNSYISDVQKETYRRIDEMNAEIVELKKTYLDFREADAKQKNKPFDRTREGKALDAHLEAIGEKGESYESFTDNRDFARSHWPLIELNLLIKDAAKGKFLALPDVEVARTDSVAVPLQPPVQVAIPAVSNADDIAALGAKLRGMDVGMQHTDQYGRQSIVGRGNGTIGHIEIWNAMIGKGEGGEQLRRDVIALGDANKDGRLTMQDAEKIKTTNPEVAKLLASFIENSTKAGHNGTALDLTLPAAPQLGLPSLPGSGSLERK